MKSPLKWAGGKSWIVPIIKPAWDQYERNGYRLVEPFCGSCAVSLGLEAKSARLNDKNPHLINFWQEVQNGLLIANDFNSDNDPGSYAFRRDLFNIGVDSHATGQPQARLFYFLNKVGFNGLCRFNLKGHFNVPFGKHKTVNHIQDFKEYVPLLKNWYFTSRNFSDIEISDKDFLFVDPPYDTQFNSYYEGGFKTTQKDVASWIVTKYPKNPVVLTNMATPDIIKIYKEFGFQIKLVMVRRSISGKPSGRVKAVEVIAYRNIPDQFINTVPAEPVGLLAYKSIIAATISNLTIYTVKEVYEYFETKPGWWVLPINQLLDEVLFIQAIGFVSLVGYSR